MRTVVQQRSVSFPKPKVVSYLIAESEVVSKEVVVAQGSEMRLLFQGQAGQNPRCRITKRRRPGSWTVRIVKNQGLALRLASSNHRSRAI